MSLRYKLYLGAQKAFAKGGFDLTRRHFYSPIPSNVPDSTWERTNPMRGIEWDVDAQMAWVEATVEPYADEFRPPFTVAGYEFKYANASFGHGDADVLYGAVRSRKPKRIVELGSGNSSVVIRVALERNAADGHPCEYDVYDPYPNDFLAGTPMAMRAHAVPAESMDDAVYSSLEAGDILFIDTTHTVRIGGDVVRIVLDALPLLAPGVLVHIHDLPLPYEYPRDMYESGTFWAEMYMVQAFLAFNRSFEVRASLRALAVERSDRFVAVAPSVAEGAPISLWIERID